VNYREETRLKDQVRRDQLKQPVSPPQTVPTVNVNTVRSFSTHGQLSAAKGSSPTVSRSAIRLIQHFDSSAQRFGPEVALKWLFSILYNPSNRQSLWAGGGVI
jgi:hypothetical protein